MALASFMLALEWPGAWIGFIFGFSVGASLASMNVKMAPKTYKFEVHVGMDSVLHIGDVRYLAGGIIVTGFNVLRPRSDKHCLLIVEVSDTLIIQSGQGENLRSKSSGSSAPQYYYYSPNCLGLNTGTKTKASPENNNNQEHTAQCHSSCTNQRLNLPEGDMHLKC